MEIIDSEFGPMKVLFRHSDLTADDLSNYVSANEEPKSAEGITFGLVLDVAIWRGVTDYRHAAPRLTSWASTHDRAAWFCNITTVFGGDEFKKVHHRQRANVIAMVLHEDENDGNWIEYVVIDDTV